MRVLYVEDNEDNVYVVKMRLELIEGFEIDVAKDGAEAVAMVAAKLPDLILMDLNLPVMDGWEATKRLKADTRTAHIPVIALTAHAMAGDRERAIAAGCDESIPSRSISTGCLQRCARCSGDDLPPPLAGRAIAYDRAYPGGRHRPIQRA